MLEVIGDLWTYPADARCITTNGTVKKNGECVMGRGCAREAALMDPLLPKILGRLIEQHGNNVFVLRRNPHLFSFPVKHQWFEQADPTLIESSARQLVKIVDEIRLKGLELKSILLPRPGCGNGHLNWVDVKSILEPILDDRFLIISKG